MDTYLNKKSAYSHISIPIKIVAVLILLIGVASGVPVLAWGSVACVFFAFVDPKYRFWYLCIVAVGLFLYYAGFFKFTLYEQARVLVGDPTGVILTAFKNNHVHIIRYLLVYPAALLNSSPGMDIDISFSMYLVLVIVPALLLFVLDILKRLKFTQKLLPNIAVCCVLALVIHFMNGRVIFSFCGLSIIIDTLLSVFCSNEHKQRVTAPVMVSAIIGFLFTNATSGTMLVALAMLIIGFFIMIRARFKITLAALLIFLGVLFPLMNIVWRFIDKNLSFSGYSLLNMMNHGMGVVINRAGHYLIPLFCVVILVIIAYYIILYNTYSKNMPLGYIYALIPIAAFGGVFGLAAGSMVVVPLIIVVTFLLHNKASAIKKKRRAKNQVEG